MTSSLHESAPALLIQRVVILLAAIIGVAIVGIAWDKIAESFERIVEALRAVG